MIGVFLLLLVILLLALFWPEEKDWKRSLLQKPGVCWTNQTGTDLRKETKEKAASGQDKAEANAILTCPQCGGRFQSPSEKRPLDFRCHFCRERIEIN